MRSSLLTILAGASTALAAVKGFNYAAQEGNQAKFEADFKIAANLKGTNGFNSARLYTMIQEGTTNTPVEAIPAAIDTNTTLLLGLWTSVDQTAFNNELTALANAIKQYGSAFTDLVVGISVGSEDLYRISATGIENKSGVGQSPSVLVDYIGQVRKAIQGTSLGKSPVGHVDTWNAFINGTNKAVIDACDFLGLDEYPYFQTTDSNGIDSGYDLFFQAYDKVQSVAPGKQIWVTEAGWPTSGKQSAQAIASVDNAAKFWKDVACELEVRNINFWWYILADSGASPSFGVTDGAGNPLYDLSCNGVTRHSTNSSSSSNSTSTSSSAAGTSTGSSATGSGSGARPTGGSGSGSGSATGSSASATASSFNAAGQVQAGVAAVLIAAFAAALL